MRCFRLITIRIAYWGKEVEMGGGEQQDEVVVGGGGYRHEGEFGK